MKNQIDKLLEYKRKRTPDTPEPSGGTPHKNPIFVIQEHHASHLHWDLRLEMGGVLRSWAVPKEPPTEKGVKRLAVQTEDHPLAYADFEGVIPEGMYGAGRVKIWDRGSLEIIECIEDKIEFRLQGRKMRGEYVLLRFKRAGPNSWLFFKR